VPLLVHSGFYPSAVLYAVYAGLVLYGFVVWLRISRSAAVEREPSEVMA
jgi:nicotinamide mononucleotide transporter